MSSLSRTVSDLFKKFTVISLVFDCYIKTQAQTNNIDCRKALSRSHFCCCTRMRSAAFEVMNSYSFRCGFRLIRNARFTFIYCS
jgi:hypothetical protein